MTATPDTPRDDDFVLTDELVRRAGVTPFTSFDDVAPQHDPFESDGEYADFLADLYVSRLTVDVLLGTALSCRRVKRN